jgi:hypothetical protein
MNPLQGMKAIWYFALILMAFSAMCTCDAKIPDLVGNWTGSMDGYILENGTVSLTKDGAINLEIAEQTGRLFYGNVSFKLNGESRIASIVGAIGSDNTTLCLSSSNGINLGKLNSDHEIELIYLQGGMAPEAFIDVFRRNS